MIPVSSPIAAAAAACLLLLTNCVTSTRLNSSRQVQFDDWPAQQIQQNNNLTTSKYVASNLSTSPQSSASEQNLNGGFLVLFDEITRMKNNSINALIRLQYFDSNSLNLKPQPTSNSNSNNLTTSKGANYSRPMQNTYKPNSNSGNRQSTRNNLACNSNVSPTRQQTLASRINSQVSGWLESLNRKVQALFVNIASGFQQPPRQHRLETTPADSRGTRGRPRERTFSPQTDARDQDQQLVKRDLSRVMLGNQQEQLCIELNPGQLARCRSIELLVGYNLNNSFPGTLQSIEDNCRHVSSLLADCWPHQLQYLRNSLASWNETVLSMTDFPLPFSSSSSSASSTAADEFANPDQQERSCGTTPQLSSLVMDRVNWMWLNLCMDRKFRLDYVENLKCLSLWTQERAQTVCSNEYRRMQLNLRSSSQPAHYPSPQMLVQQSEPRRQPRAIDFVPAINIPTSSGFGQQPAGGQLQQQQQQVGRLVDEREIESKILCCIFDLFLRCVNRQAVRDCGRHGGQFVVNFMSRIGTDDMKYLCNSEPRSASSAPLDNMRQPFGSGAGQPMRTNNNPQRLASSSSSSQNKKHSGGEKSPFIQSNYCTDSRIVAVLYGKLVDVYGGHGANQMPQTNQFRPQISGDSHFGISNNNRHNSSNNNNQANYDQNFFGSDTPGIDSGGSVATKPALPQLILVVAVVCIIFSGATRQMSEQRIVY